MPAIEQSLDYDPDTYSSHGGNNGRVIFVVRQRHLVDSVINAIRRSGRGMSRLVGT